MRRLRLRAAVLLALAPFAFAACDDSGVVTVHSLSFQGVHAVDQTLLKQAIATRENSKVPVVGWELPWTKKHGFDQPRFDADLQRIKAFYADRGYPDATVTNVAVVPNAKKSAVDVTVTIEEGKPVNVAAVVFSGFDVIPEKHVTALQHDTPLKVGQPRDRQTVVAAHELALNELRDHGYPYAAVTTSEDDGPDGKAATVSFTAVPGILAHFGTVEISGNHSVSDHMIDRELSYHPGDLYQRSEVQNSQRRLYSMELFQFVNIQTVAPGTPATPGTPGAPGTPDTPDASTATPADQSPEVETKVTVAEGKHQRLNFGVGYGTEEKERVDGEYHHVNFLGGARSAGLHARWSSLDRGIRADFTQPFFLAPHLSIGGEVEQWYTYTPAYNSIVTGGRATFTHRADEKTSWSLSFTSERDNSTIDESFRNSPTFPELRNDLIALGLNPSTDHQEGTLNALGFDVNRSTADSLLDAHHGYQASLHAEQAGRFLPGTFNYFAVSVDGRQFTQLGRRIVVASRLQFGNIAQADNNPANVPFSKKYFLGGATSLRGWGRYEVSPVGESGIPLGGNSLFAVSEEVRAVISGNFGGVIFADAGNVWTDLAAMNLGDLRYDIGPGLRYQTPVGPVRLDFGYQLNAIPGLIVNGLPETRHWRIHFSIGQAF
jgi:outer membrane protein assembly factor BamA